MHIEDIDLIQELLENSSHSSSSSNCASDKETTVFAQPQKTKIKRKRNKEKKKEWACLACETGKRKCDKRMPTCSRCVQTGKDCVYREGQFPQQAIQGVNEMTKIELLMDELFVTSLLENFDKTMGLMFTFRKELCGDISLLHSTPARSVRTDSALSCVCRGMGWASQSLLYSNRARNNAISLFSETSEEALSAISMLWISNVGGELDPVKKLMGHTARTLRPDFDTDPSRGLMHFLKGTVWCVFRSEAKVFLDQVLTTCLARVPLRAEYVRPYLFRRLSLDVIATYGPWDYSDFRDGFLAETNLSDESAKAKLIEIDSGCARFEMMRPSLAEMGTDVLRLITERLTIIASAVRAVLYFRLGDFEACRRTANVCLDAFGTLTSSMWFFQTVSDVIHLLDISMGMQDQNIFDKAMKIMRQMAPVVPLAEKIVFALSEVAPFSSSPTTRTESTIESILEETIDSPGDWITVCQ